MLIDPVNKAFFSAAPAGYASSKKSKSKNKSEYSLSAKSFLRFSIWSSEKSSSDNPDSDSSVTEKSELILSK